MLQPHFHGGELTEGIYDDYWRHCITKLSHIHFVANDSSKKRLIQMGESENSIFKMKLQFLIENIH